MSQSDYNFVDFLESAARALKVVGSFFLVVLLTLLCVLIWLLAQNAVTFKKTLSDVDASVTTTTTNLNTTMGVVFTAAENLNDSASDLETTLSQERQAFAAQLQDTDALIGKLNGVADSANSAIGTASSTLRTLDTAIGTQNNALTETQAQLRGSLETIDQQTALIGPLLDAGKKTVADLDARVNDPDVGDTIHHIDHTMDNVDDATAHVDAWVDRVTAPIRGFWNHAKAFLFTIAGPAAQVATAAK